LRGGIHGEYEGSGSQDGGSGTLRFAKHRRDFRRADPGARERGSGRGQDVGKGAHITTPSSIHPRATTSAMAAGLTVIRWLLSMPRANPLLYARRTGMVPAGHPGPEGSALMKS
jgi:hypothetical protein